MSLYGTEEYLVGGSTGSSSFKRQYKINPRQICRQITFTYL